MVTGLCAKFGDLLKSTNAKFASFKVTSKTLSDSSTRLGIITSVQAGNCVSD